jgi:glucokinase
MKSNHALCLDIGGGHVTSALVDTASKSIIWDTRQRVETNPNASAESLIKDWSQAGRNSLKRGGGFDLSHVGIAMPGPFDYEQGVSKMEHKFASLHECDVRHLLREAWKDALDCPIRFANDADLFVLGEFWAGAGMGANRMIGITLGTGLGSGFIEKGRILTEDSRIPEQGEIWNVPHELGKAEDYASGEFLTALFEESTGEGKDGREIASLAFQGDPKAQGCFHALGENLVAILQPWVRSFSPDVIVFGGSISKSFDLFGQAMGSELDVRCVKSAHFEDASLYGGAALGEIDD